MDNLTLFPDELEMVQEEIQLLSDMYAVPSYPVLLSSY